MITIKTSGNRVRKSIPKQLENLVLGLKQSSPRFDFQNEANIIISDLILDKMPEGLWLGRNPKFSSCFGISPRANRAFGGTVLTRWAVFPSEVDDLQMQFIPGFFREAFFKVFLGFFDRFSIAQPPAGCAAMDVRIHRESGLSISLHHDDRGGFMSYTG